MKIVNDQILMDYLLENYNRTKAKNMLKYKEVKVNGKVITQYDYALKAGDDVPSGLLSERTAKESKRTAYMMVKNYVGKKHEQLYLVHRLDQDTSGVLMFVKNKKLYEYLTHHWNDCVTMRSYYGVVEGKMIGRGTIDNYLAESRGQEVYITKKGGQRAITHYEAIVSNKRCSLVHVLLDTGRKNQIRVHMASLHHPIMGDKKYGARSNELKRLALHADTFSFIHPFTHQKMTFTTAIPDSFEKVVKKH
ncbi:RluA family pseudouridine synthase [Sharpea azabuensis]|uniref:RluA family pseudouridine synthase n=1 Tax=Sharpea azabuensis TaxID=322505 RepID=UPI001567F57A|nr:RluA family pseudouridine synthase [Sharpea azabuensis]